MTIQLTLIITSTTIQLTSYYYQNGNPTLFLLLPVWQSNLLFIITSMVNQLASYYYQYGNPTYFLLLPVWQSNLFLIITSMAIQHASYYYQYGNPTYFLLLPVWQSNLLLCIYQYGNLTNIKSNLHLNIFESCHTVFFESEKCFALSISFF